MRFLNDDNKTDYDLIKAHLATHGTMGLFWVGAHAVNCIAGIIRSIRTTEGATA